MNQSRTMSLVEAVANVAVGYVLAIATQLVMFPVFGIEAALGEHLAIGLAFVGVSLARGYLLRRLFEALACAVDSLRETASSNRSSRSSRPRREGLRF